MRRKTLTLLFAIALQAGFSQRVLQIPNAEKTEMESMLPPIYTPDTTGTFDGHYIVANLYEPVQYRHDTVFWNNGLYYLDKYFGSVYPRDTLCRWADTILYRNYSLALLDEAENVVYKMIGQQHGFYWSKSLPLPDSTFLEPPVYAKGDKNTKCLHFPPPKKNAVSKSTICSHVEVCDLGDAVTYAWCSDMRYTKIFEDNFESANNDLNLNYWVIGKSAPRGERFYNGDTGWDAKQMVEVSNGTLKLTCKKQTGFFQDTDHPTPGLGTLRPPGLNYLNGEISTNFKMGYGKYEIRARLPVANGSNMAFWVFGEEVEIDGFEMATNGQCSPMMSIYSNRVNRSADCEMAYGGMYRIFQLTGGPGLDAWKSLTNLCAGQWVQYTIVYDPNYIAFWAHDEATGKKWVLVHFNIVQADAQFVNPRSNCSCTGCRIQRMENFPDHLSKGVNLLLSNTALAGGGPSSPITMEVDWVKIYAPLDCGKNKALNQGAFYAPNNNFQANYITGDFVSFGDGSGNSNGYYKVEYNAPHPYPSRLDGDKSMFVSANDEVELYDGFFVEEGAVFEANNAFRGNVYVPLPDCQTLTYSPQYFKQVKSEAPLVAAKKEEVTSDYYFRAYPNPANDALYIESAQAVRRIELFDAYGRGMATGNATKVLDVKSLPAGLYYLKVYFAHYIETTKFIKQ